MEERQPAPAQDWNKQLQNIIKLARMGAAVSYSAVQRILRELENDPIVIDSQEGGVCEENEPVRVLHQILRHVLQQAEMNHITNDIIFVGEEYLDLMQDILGKNKPPLKRRPDEEPTTRGRAANAASSATTSSIRGEHIVKFMRRQTADAVRVAAGGLFTVAGIIGEHAPLEDDSRLVRDIAGELHSMSRHLPGGALHQLRPLPPSDMVQWERHLQKEEQEAREAAEAPVDAPEGEAGGTPQALLGGRPIPRTRRRRRWS